jgi:hypothetical protein
MRKFTKLFIFLFFLNVSLFSQEEIGRITLDIRATREEADYNNYWYYITFTNTLPETYTKVQDIVNLWSTQHTSGFFRKTPDGFELKAKYEKDAKSGILNLWLDYDMSGRMGYGIFRNLALILQQRYNFLMEENDDRYTFDYEWSSLMYFTQYGYFGFKKIYIFYRR